MSKNKNFLSSPLQTFRFAIAPHKKLYATMWVLVIITDVIGGLFPYFLKQIVDTIVANPSATELNHFITPLVLIVVTLIAYECSGRLAHLTETYIAPNIFRHITTSLYSSLIKRPTSYFENKFSGDLGRRIEQVGNGVLHFIESFPWEFGWISGSIIMSIVLLATTHIFVLFTFLAWLLLFILTSIPLLKKYYGYSAAVATAHAELSGTVIDSLSNVSLIHSFGALAYEEQLNHTATSVVVDNERRARWYSIANKMQQGWSVIVLTTALVLVSLVLYSRGEFSVGNFVIIASVIPSMIGVIWNLGDIFLRTSRHVGELSDAIATLRENQDPLQGGVEQVTTGHQFSIDYEHIAFQYEGTDASVFTNFNLHIEQGEHVGIVGTSGAGKSTLIKLLLRQYTAQRGSIKIGHTDIADLTLNSFNSLISYVPQDTSLFHRTLFDNILYARPNASREEVIDASKKAHAHDFINDLQEKYETKVGERGIKLSGGQRQRIALARAILKNSPILVLDEATSSLDTESESVIQEALLELFKNRTVVAIAHRLSTLRAMDRIVVVEAGTIVESGNPQELLQEQRSIFKRMWEQQKNGFV